MQHKLTTAVVVTVFASSSAFADVKIDINHNDVAYEVSPEKKIIKDTGGTTFFLSGNRVSRYEAGYVTGSTISGQQVSVNLKGELANITYKINNNVITEISEYNGFIERTVVRTDKKSRCYSKTTFQPKGSAKYMTEVINGETIIVSKALAKDESCVISIVPDGTVR